MASNVPLAVYPQILNEQIKIAPDHTVDVCSYPYGSIVKPGLLTTLGMKVTLRKRRNIYTATGAEVASASCQQMSHLSC